jgi:hypothetical protein
MTPMFYKKIKFKQKSYGGWDWSFLMDINIFGSFFS